MRLSARALLVCSAFSVSSAVHAEEPKAFVHRKLAEYDQALLSKNLTWFNSNWDRGYSENMGGAAVSRREALEMMKSWFAQVTLTKCESKLISVAEIVRGKEWHVVAQTTMEGLYKAPGKAAVPLRSFIKYQQEWMVRISTPKLLNMSSISRNTKVDGKTIKP